MDIRSSSVCSFFLSVSSFFWSLAWCPWRRIVCSLVSSSEVSENSSGFWRPGRGGEGREEGERRRVEREGGRRGRKIRKAAWMGGKGKGKEREEEDRSGDKETEAYFIEAI